jgi:hypothetical protein
MICRSLITETRRGTLSPETSAVGQRILVNLAGRAACIDAENEREDMIRCSYRTNRTACIVPAISFLVDPSAQVHPDLPLCREHGPEMVRVLEEKAGEKWGLVEIEQKATPE